MATGLSGLASGVDTSSIVAQLMGLARQSREPGLQEEHGDLGNIAIYTYMDFEAAARSIPNSACTGGSATTNDHMPTLPMVPSTSATPSRIQA